MNNHWRYGDFFVSGLGYKRSLIEIIYHFFYCIKWSWQRAYRGYSDRDMWRMDKYLEVLLIEMLQDLKDFKEGQAKYYGWELDSEIDESEENVQDGGTYEPKDRILRRMIYLCEEQKHGYVENDSELDKKYNRMCKELLAIYDPKFSGGKVAISRRCDEDYAAYKERIESECAELHNKVQERDKMNEEYRQKCREEFFEMMKKHFVNLHI